MQLFCQSNFSLLVITQNVWDQKETSVLMPMGTLALIEPPGGTDTRHTTTRAPSITELLQDFQINCCHQFLFHFLSSCTHSTWYICRTSTQGSSLNSVILSSFALMPLPPLVAALAAPVAMFGFAGQAAVQSASWRGWERRRDGPSFCFFKRGSWEPEEGCMNSFPHSKFLAAIMKLSVTP